MRDPKTRISAKTRKSDSPVNSDKKWKKKVGQILKNIFFAHKKSSNKVDQKIFPVFPGFLSAKS